MSLLLPTRYAQQPQQGASVDRSTRIGAGAVAVVIPTMDINWATGKQLTRGNAGSFKRLNSGGHQTYGFQDFWLETETLPAIGTSPYVMYWLGWPIATGCRLGVNDCGFVVGSSNNTLGITINMGNVRGTGNASSSINNWGGCNNNWPTNYTANETLTLGSSGAPVFLMMVRRADGTLEFWRNGVLVNTVSLAVTSIAAFKMEVGTFIAQLNWVSNNLTALAGLSILQGDPSRAELQAFAANPYGIIKSPNRLLFSAASAAPTDTGLTPGAGILTSTGFAPIVAQSANAGLTPAAGALTTTGYAPAVAQSNSTGTAPAPASLTTTGYAPTIAQPQGVGLVPGAIATAGYAPTVTQSIITGVSPGAGAVATAGYAPTVSRTANAGVSPAAGSNALAGFAPTVSQSANVGIAPGAASAGLIGYAPTVRQAVPGVGVYPPPNLVAAGVKYGPNGDDYIGTYVAGLTPDQSDMLTALAKIHGLVAGTPLVVGQTSRAAGDVVQTITENAGTVTIARA
jgi:hypothetical protein